MHLCNGQLLQPQTPSPQTPPSHSGSLFAATLLGVKLSLCQACYEFTPDGQTHALLTAEALLGVPATPLQGPVRV